MMNIHERQGVVNMTMGGYGLLHVASHFKSWQVCKYLVDELRLDVNARDIDGATPLSCAALFGEGVTRFLLGHGADPNKNDNGGCAPLHNAAQNGNNDVVRLLLSAGARPDTSIFHGTPLHIAASYGKVRAVKTLLDYHANPNWSSESSSTPLLKALNSTNHGLLESDALDCVKLLVKYGRMPIQIAANTGRRRLVETLFAFSSPIGAIPEWTVDGIIAHEKSRCSTPKKIQGTSRSTVECPRMKRNIQGVGGSFSKSKDMQYYTPQCKKSRTANTFSSPQPCSSSVIINRISQSAQSGGEKKGSVAKSATVSKRCRRMLEYSLSSESSESSSFSPSRIGTITLEVYASKFKDKLSKLVQVPYQKLQGR